MPIKTVNIPDEVLENIDNLTISNDEKEELKQDLDRLLEDLNEQ
ncbi:hypothetical protein [Bacillus sp. AFS040349]|nr:hypothetical protein [Bacillus sp. AFS040349]